MADDKILSEKNLKTLITAESSHIVRRPGVGLSEIAGTLLSGLDVLSNVDEVGFNDFLKKFEHRVLEQLQVINTNSSIIDTTGNCGISA